MGDMISSLPDEILFHILSFLPTKYAVGTSGVSRRWKDLWTGLYELDLDNRDSSFRIIANCNELRERDLKFCRFVDRVLRQHRDLNSLRRFRFHVAVQYLERKAKPNFLMRTRLASDESQLEEMDVKFDGYGFIGSGFHLRWLPETFLTLKHLKVLKLQGVIMVTICGSVRLPSVKILQLLRLVIQGCESLSVLISGCPVLEILHLENCSSNRNGNYKLIASLPFLKNLTIIDSRSYHNSLCPFAIESPSLEQLYLQDFAELQFLGTSGPLPCLHSVRVQMDHCQISGDGLIWLLARISYAREMCLSWKILSLLSEIDDTVELPMFPNLTHLTIATAGSNCALHSLLNTASKLQSLVIDLGDYRGAMQWEESEEPACTPECLLSSLEEVKIKNLKADEDEMKMVAYLLEAGTVLKKVNMHVYNGDDDDDDDDETHRDCFVSLLKLPRGSRACEVHLLLRNGDLI